MAECGEVQISENLSEVFDDWDSMSTRDKIVATRTMEWCSKNLSKLVGASGRFKDELLCAFNEVLETYYQVSFEEVMGRGRQRENVDFRNMVMHLYWMESRLSLKAAGKVCGKCHSTLIHSFRDLAYQLEHSENYRREYNLLKYRLMAKIHEQ